MTPGTRESLEDVKPALLRVIEQSASLLDRVDTLLAQNTELLSQNAKLLARVAELEAKLGMPPKTPDNSSVPPSRGQKTNAAAVPLGVKTRRKSRPGVARVLCENPDETRDVYAERCGCGAALAPADQPDAFDYDHIDLPPIKPVTTRVRLYKGRCPCCHARVTAEPPAGMAPGSPFGPGIVALATYLHTTQMVSFSRLTEVFQGLFGLKISEGAITNMLARAATPFAAEREKIAAIVRASPVIASDETSARVCKKTFWQWVFATKTAVLHIIAASRGKVVPTEFLAGATPDVWLSDRLAAQATHGRAHQVCLAHLIRDAQFAMDAGDTVFAPPFLALLKKACGIGRRRPEMTDAAIKAEAQSLAKELDRLLALKPAQKDGADLRASIAVGARDKLLVFLGNRDVEPTNNVSERALRPSVIFRKVTNCFRSQWGAQLYADICSIVATGRLHGRSPLASIRATLATPATTGA
jgi:transposase